MLLHAVTLAFFDSAWLCFSSTRHSCRSAVQRASLAAHAHVEEPQGNQHGGDVGRHAHPVESLPGNHNLFVSDNMASDRRTSLTLVMLAHVFMVGTSRF